MIFVSTGSRKFQFNRLIEELDSLVKEGKLKEVVFAQIAETTYIPKNLDYQKYLSPEEYNDYIDKADLIISHAGTGALINPLKKGKQVIAVPRLSKFGEHSDDHQLQVATALEEAGYLRVVRDINELGSTIQKMYNEPIQKKYARESNILSIVEDKIKEWFDA